MSDATHTVRSEEGGDRVHPDRAYFERAVSFVGAQGPMHGVLCTPAGTVRASMLIVAGQPQTRVGSHRMFVELARGVAAHGVASLRFDIGGWGDSEGEALPFEQSDQDIAAAAVFLSSEAGRLRRDAAGADQNRGLDSPSPTSGSGDGGNDEPGRMLASSGDVPLSPGSLPLSIWGLCDGASAAVLALPVLRAAGVQPLALYLVNPWVRSDASLSDAMVRTYYGKRFLSGEFWARLLTGKVPLRNLLEPVRHLFRRGGGSQAQAPGTPSEPGAPPAQPQPDLPSQLLARLASYRGRVVTVLSGNDLTAAETESLLRREKRWRRRIERDGEVIRVPGADHTFSDPGQWRALIEQIGKLAASQD